MLKKQTANKNHLLPEGFSVFKNYLDIEQQKQIISAVDSVLEQSPAYINTMRNGTRFKVANASAGQFGWVSDAKGYRYEKLHPETATPWPEIPENILKIVKELCEKTENVNFKAQSCYINLYPEKSSLGLHRDDTEKFLSAPIISISIGETAEFLLGGLKKEDETQKILLESGDCYVQGGTSRLFYHAVKKVLKGTNDVLGWGSRINLTIRQVVE